MKKFFVFALAAATLLAACSKSDDGPSLAVSKSTIDVQSLKAEGEFTISATGAWSIECSNPEMFRLLEPLSGSGDATIYYTVKGNPAMTQRSATLTITMADAAPKTVVITQAASSSTNPKIKVVHTRVNADPSMGGLQLLLDDTGTFYGTKFDEYTENLGSLANASAVYAQYGYTVPSPINKSLYVLGTTTPAEAMISVPAGTYDWIMLMPAIGMNILGTAYDGDTWEAYCGTHEFENGITYVFTMNEYIGYWEFSIEEE